MGDNLGNNIGKSYAESEVEKNNKKISIRLFIVGLIIAIILCGVGFVRQNYAKKTNEERAQQAYEQSQQEVEQAKKRLEEISTEKATLKQQYEAKQQEADSINVGDPNFFVEKSRVQEEASELSQKIVALDSEAFLLENGNYTVYYQLVKPITYMIFYYIAAGVFVVLSLIALIYFLVTRKK